MVVIGHGGGLDVLSAPAAALVVRAGQTVRKGQLIGYMGATGNATGPAPPLGGLARRHARQPARVHLTRRDRRATGREGSLRHPAWV